MNPSDVIKAVMKEQGCSIIFLSQKLGYKRASSISDKLNRRDSMRVMSLIEMADALDCEVILKQRTGSKKTYVLTYDKPENED